MTFTQKHYTDLQVRIFPYSDVNSGAAYGLGTMKVMSSILPTGSVVPVSGVSHRQEFVRRMNVGDAVILEHDFSNPYDTNAVRVRSQDGSLLGYVPAKGGLAARLSENSPGGIWDGTIVDVLDGAEFCGLRVRVGEVVENVPVRVGANNAGLRVGGSDVHIATDIVSDVDSKDPVKYVFTVSGRPLGVFVDERGGNIRVKLEGVVASWPVRAVVVTDAPVNR